jgi:hypothetical protein
MVLNDVWRTIGDEVGFFYEKTFDDVPSSAGVYAWFYPLRIFSRTPEGLEQFVTEVQTLLNYDSESEGPSERTGLIPVVWWSWALAASRIPKPLQLSDSLRRAWGEICAREDLYSDFQKSLLKASVFMPPLYVGKADNLNTRCGQHLSGSDSANDFHRRFEDFARRLNLRVRNVRQLVFACVRTGATVDEAPGLPISPMHELVESIMKSICAPPYGMR